MTIKPIYLLPVVAFFGPTALMKLFLWVWSSQLNEFGVFVLGIISVMLTLSAVLIILDE